MMHEIPGFAWNGVVCIHTLNFCISIRACNGATHELKLTLAPLSTGFWVGHSRIIEARAGIGCYIVCILSQGLAKVFLVNGTKCLQSWSYALAVLSERAASTKSTRIARQNATRRVGTKLQL